MAIVRCMRNHYYDNSKDVACPYCEQEGSMSGMESMITSYYSLPYDGDYDDGMQKTEAYGACVEECDKTIGMYKKDIDNEVTVGWIVCVNGLMKGKSYTIHEGRNFAGRSYEMDIILSDDNTICRNKHFSIVYEPKSIQFYLIPGEGRTYLNGKAVIEICGLEENDMITAGESNFIFVPFCKTGCIWQ